MKKILLLPLLIQISAFSFLDEGINISGSTSRVIKIIEEQQENAASIRRKILKEKQKEKKRARKRRIIELINAGQHPTQYTKK